MTTEKEITIANLGPIEELHIKLAAPGVTRVIAPNGAGKSIACSAMQSLAAGKGKLPLRDGADRGTIDGLGIHASILPTQTRCAGEFSISMLEGKLDLARIVDPGVSDPVAADKRRIQALVSLSGVEAKPELFTRRPTFSDTFDAVVRTETRHADDLVDMAARVARDYHTEARQWEKLALEDDAKAATLKEQIAAIDMTVESDAEKLQQAFIDAQSAYGKAQGRTNAKVEKAKQADDARQELQRWDTRGIPTDAAEAEKKVGELFENIEKLEGEAELARQHIATIQRALEEDERKIAAHKLALAEAQAERERIQTHVERREACLKVIADYEQYEAPSDEELAQRKDAVKQAREAMDAGVRVRDAKFQQSAYEQALESAQARRLRAEKMRQAAAETDDVVSDALATEVFKIQTLGTHKRLVVFHEKRDAWVEYHTLSATERWLRALDAGCEKVGPGGLLFVSQEAWEGIDCWNRRYIHEHAVAKGVYLLAFEATRDEADGKEFVTKAGA